MMRVVYIANQESPIKRVSQKQRLLAIAEAELVENYARDEMKAREKHKTLLDYLEVREQQLKALKKAKNIKV